MWGEKIKEDVEVEAKLPPWRVWVGLSLKRGAQSQKWQQAGNVQSLETGQQFLLKYQIGYLLLDWAYF